MLKLKNVKFSYPNKQVLDNISLELSKNENLVIIGRSGCGKTTLLHIIAGLLKPSAGEVEFNGTKLDTLNEQQIDKFRSENVGLIFQQFHLVPAITCENNIKLANDNISAAEINELLAKLDITEIKYKKPSQLSIGQKQRLAVARALANKPKLIIADEPTSNLDDESAEKTIELLTNYAKEAGAQLIIASHDLRLKNKFTNIMEM